MAAKPVGAGDAVSARPSRERQEGYWEYWQTTRSVSEWAAERAAIVMEIFRDLGMDHPKILDFGCGTGWFSEALAEFGETTGIDLSKKAMEAAAERSPHIRFVGGDLFEHPLETQAFDVVVSMQVIAHVGDQARFIRRAAELLRTGGFLIVTTNNRFVMERQGTLGLATHKDVGHIEEWLTVRELRRLASRHFRILTTRTVLPLGNGGVLRLVNSSKLNKVAGLVLSESKIRQLKERLGFGYYIILVARKL